MHLPESPQAKNLLVAVILGIACAVLQDEAICDSFLTLLTLP